MAVQIRDARREDMQQVFDRIQELAEFEKEPEAVEITVAQLEADGFGEKPLFHCFVAEEGEDIVGIALVYFRYSTWKGKVVHLEDLIVKESYRGRGIGSDLYTEVMRYAFDHDIKRVSWEVLDWNTPAVNFYKNSGAKILDGWQVVQMDEKGLVSYLREHN